MLKEPATTLFFGISTQGARARAYFAENHSLPWFLTWFIGVLCGVFLGYNAPRMRDNSTKAAMARASSMLAFTVTDDDLQGFTNLPKQGEEVTTGKEESSPATNQDDSKTVG